MNEWEMMSQIARTVLIMSAAGSVVALLLFAAKPLVKNRLPKNVQYYLWTIVLIALLVPFCRFLTIPFSTPLAPVQEIIASSVKSTPEWQDEIAKEQYNKPYSQLSAREQVEISYVAIGLTSGHFNNYILLSLIVSGIAVFLFEIAQYFIFTIKLRRRRENADDVETKLLHALCEKRRRPQLYRSPLAQTPMLIGVFKPVIYLPDTQYSEVQLRNILLHELAHFKRHDVAIKWLAAFSVQVHWFNPIVYFMRREIDRACELACDEAVIKNMQTSKKQEYGDTLIAVVAEKRLPTTVMSTTMCEDKKSLKERLSAIMKSKKLTKKIAVISCALLILTLCVTIILGATAPQKTTEGARLFSATADGSIADGHNYRFYEADGNLVWQIP